MKKSLFAFIILVLHYYCSSAFDIQIPVSYDTLNNGLRVIIVRDTNVAVVSCRLYYFVGSIYEAPGSTGLSHMYEHMMFKGTRIMGTTDYTKEKKYIDSIDSLDNLIHALKRKGASDSDSLIGAYTKQIYSLLEKQRFFIKKDEIWEYYTKNGATNLNAWTSDDMTAYIVTLPQNKLELFFWIEADRMQNIILREFPSERDVILEERRMRYENRPLNKYWEQLSAHFYIAHPYRNPTIGWMSDIQSFTREKLNEFIHRYYTPDNAVIVLAGNVLPKEAMAQIKKYFGPIPRSNHPKQDIVTREPDPIGETRFVVYDNAQPRIDILFHTPGYPHDDLYSLDVIEGIFSGRSGRLYRRLVEKEKLCIDVSASNAYKLHNGYFHIWALLKEQVDPKRVEKILFEELDKLKKEPPSQLEMERIKNEIQMEFVSQIKSLEVLSDQLAWFERLRSWKDLQEYPKHIAAVSVQNIPRIVQRYFASDLKTIGMLLQKKEAQKEKAQQRESDQ